MDKRKALELLKLALDEIPNLREKHYDNQEFELWRSKVRDIIKAGLDPDDFNTYTSSYPSIGYTRGLTPDHIIKEAYQEELTSCDTALKSILQKYEMLGIEEKSSVIEVPPESVFRVIPPKSFIAHGGQSPILDKLKDFLIALGIEPLVVEEQASENRSVGDNVDYYARQADFAIILATKGDIDGTSGGFIPRGNVLIEIGKSQEIFKDRIIYLLQAGTKFPTNVSEKVWGRFTTERMDDAFIKIARELHKFGILKAVKPPFKETSS